MRQRYPLHRTVHTIDTGTMYHPVLSSLMSLKTVQGSSCSHPPPPTLGSAKEATSIDTEGLIFLFFLHVL